MWSFNYTDEIGAGCQRLYELSNDSKVKALLLYTITDVGIDHNRYYVLDLAVNLFIDLKRDIVVAMELEDLFKERVLNIRRLAITKDSLPTCLQDYYDY